MNWFGLPLFVAVFIAQGLSGEDERDADFSRSGVVSGVSMRLSMLNGMGMFGREPGWAFPVIIPWGNMSSIGVNDGEVGPDNTE